MTPATMNSDIESAAAEAVQPGRRRPRICIFTETFHPVIGGGETQARLLGQGLVRNGFPVVILTRRSDRSLARVDRVDDLPVRRLAPTGAGRFKKWGLLLSGVPALLRMRREYDLVFVSGFRIIGVAAVLVGRMLGKPVVLKADSQGEMSGGFFRAGLARFGMRASTLPFRLFLALRNAVLRHAHAFAAITDDVAVELNDAAIDPAAIHRIPNAVDTTRFYPPATEQKLETRRRLGLPAGGAIVVYTGRLVSYKGLPLLLDVWSKLQPRHPAARLLLIGTGGLDTHACEDELRAATRAGAMEHSVIFTGGVENVHEYLHAADIFAFPTENDAFPSSLIEAMATGLPVITTPVGAIPEVVENEVNGLLVEPRDGDALLEALERLLTDPELVARLGRAGWRTVQDSYSAERVTQRYIQLFTQLGGGKTPDPGAAV